MTPIERPVALPGILLVGTIWVPLVAVRQIVPAGPESADLAELAGLVETPRSRVDTYGGDSYYDTADAHEIARRYSVACQQETP